LHVINGMKCCRWRWWQWWW